MEATNLDVPNNYKVCVIGESGVGKTALINRYTTGSFTADYRPTVSASFVSAREFVENRVITLNIWDTAGQEKYQSMMPIYTRNVECVLLVFDVLRPSSWEYIIKWINDNYDQLEPTPIFTFCANKCDCGETFSIKEIEEQISAGIDKVRNAAFFTTSALTGENVAVLFNSIGAKLCAIEGKVRKQKSLQTKSNSSSCC